MGKRVANFDPRYPGTAALNGRSVYVRCDSESTCNAHLACSTQRTPGMQRTPGGRR
jgi:hypothetical protein